MKCRVEIIGVMLGSIVSIAVSASSDVVIQDGAPSVPAQGSPAPQEPPGLTWFPSPNQGAESFRVQVEDQRQSVESHRSLDPSGDLRTYHRQIENYKGAIKQYKGMNSK
jgi:hypothetical protein